MMTEMSTFAKAIMDRTYAHDLEDNQQESWEQIAYRVTKNVMRAVGVDMRQQLAKEVCRVITERKFIPGGRYLYAAGRQYHQVNNCLLLRVHDSREGWSELLSKASLALMSGAGIGVDYSDIRHEGARIRKTGGVATGPISLMQILNECGRGIMQGGNRRSAIWAGLKWSHPDVHKFIRVKNWPPEIHKLKAHDYSFPAMLDCTNISVQLDDEFFEAYHDDEHDKHALAHGVYWATVEQMLRTGEPGFTVDVGKNSTETLRNACGEVSSRDTDDICNLGSVNLARVESLDEFKRLIDLAAAFLLAGTVYSDVPYSNVDRVRSKNRRLGIGLMGIHEWLLKHGKSYAPDEELGTWLATYAKSNRYANKWADEWELSRPKKTRAIAPNGTTGIVAETTGGIEPIFCVAYKRRYLKGEQFCYQYVVDPTAKRLIQEGVEPSQIEDAYRLARDVEKRVAFQAWVQGYVDHCISSTINLPAYGSELNNKDTIRPFGSMLLRYLPQLRGITCYPDGGRSGQPLTPVPYEEAASQEGAELVEEAANVCDLTKAGSCGD
jgi:ribonucleoside-diphosphate reductase alpha chain